MSVKKITTDDLRRMNNSEGLVLQGCGGELQEWIDGINDMLTESKDAKGEMQYSDTVFALTAEARSAMNDAVVSAYEEQLDMQEDESEEESEDESEDFVQSM